MKTELDSSIYDRYNGTVPCDYEHFCSCYRPFFLFSPARLLARSLLLSDISASIAIFIHLPEFISLVSERKE